MNTLLNHNGKKATINVNTAYDKENNVTTSALTWDELTDSNKQDIASEWIRDHIHTNVNQVIELLAETYDHCDYNDYYALSESKDFTYAVESDLQDKTIDELIEIAEDYDLSIEYRQLFVIKYLNDLIENTNNTNFSISNCYKELEITFGQSLKAEDDYTQQEIEQELINFFINCYDDMTNDYLLFDDLDTCIINLGINFDGYLKAYKSDLITLIEKELDYDQYGCDNALEPECDQAYEFYSVSDHFKAMLPENCENLLGLTVWARFCTGQSICLDHQVQLAAFKVLSDCSYKYY